MIELPFMIHHKELKNKEWLAVCIIEVYASLTNKDLNLNNSRRLKVENEFCSIRINVARRSKQYTVIVREE